MGEHEHEPLRGFPGSLPPGETLLWQGRPGSWHLARQLFPLRAIGGYFLLFAGWRLYAGIEAAVAPSAIGLGVGVVLLMALAVLGSFVAYATMIARSTVFSITNRRVLVRFGLTLPKTWNVPFGSIETASFKPQGRSGVAGDLCITVNEGERIPYMLLWPYARAWKLRHPQPLLRALPDGARVASLLSRALAATLARSPAVTRAGRDFPTSANLPSPQAS